MFTSKNVFLSDYFNGYVGVMLAKRSASELVSEAARWNESQVNTVDDVDEIIDWARTSGDQELTNMRMFTQSEFYTLAMSVIQYSISHRHPLFVAMDMLDAVLAVLNETERSVNEQRGNIGIVLDDAMKRYDHN